MSRRVVLIAGAALLLLLLFLAGAAGYIIGKPFTSAGGGQNRPSPDGKWVAHAVTFQKRSLFGPRQTFSELRIETSPPSHTVRKMVFQDTAEPPIDWRQEGEIFWVRNSSAVTFKCVTGNANFEVTLTPGR